MRTATSFLPYCALNLTTFSTHYFLDAQHENECSLSQNAHSLSCFFELKECGPWPVFSRKLARSEGAVANNLQVLCVQRHLDNVVKTKAVLNWKHALGE